MRRPPSRLSEAGPTRYAPDRVAASRAFPAFRRSQLHISRRFNYGNDFTMQFPDPDTPLVPIARVAFEPVHKVPGGVSWARVHDTYPRYIEKVIRARARTQVGVLVRFAVEGGGGGGGVSTIKITWADTRAAQRRRPGSPARVSLLLIPYLLSSSSARPIPSHSSTSAPGWTRALGPPLDLESIATATA